MARSAVAHHGIGISRERRSPGEGGCQWDIGWKINATVHNTATPETFRDWPIESLANSRLKGPLQSTSSSQSRPCCRWFLAGLAPRTKHSPDAHSRKALSPYRFECSSRKEPENFGFG